MPHHNSAPRKISKEASVTCAGLTTTYVGQDWAWWFQVSCPIAIPWMSDSCIQMLKPATRPQASWFYCWKCELCNEVKTDFIYLIFIEDIFNDAWIFLNFDCVLQNNLLTHVEMILKSRKPPNKSLGCSIQQLISKYWVLEGTPFCWKTKANNYGTTTEMGDVPNLTDKEHQRCKVY